MTIDLKTDTDALFPASCPHQHAFSSGNPPAERRIHYALWLTVAMMVLEIIGGWWFGSMAVLADGWHMGSHALALGLAVGAYICARHFRDDQRFAFGTWKIEILASFTSALLMLGVALLMLFESASRWMNPAHIQHHQAIALAVLGLAVNLLCAWWLRDQPHEHAHDHHHHHEEEQHDHHHHHHARDLNQHSAYLHVLADAATSVLAIIALLGSLYFQADWLDPLMGIVGAALISNWAWGLIRQSAQILLDAQMNLPLVQAIRHTLENSPLSTQINDLHVWQVGQGRFACVLELMTASGTRVEALHQLLSRAHPQLVHCTIELRTA